MRLNTHRETPPRKTPRIVIALLILLVVMLVSMIVTVFILLILDNEIILGVVILSIFALLFTLAAFRLCDVEKAYVEILEDRIIVVDFYFSIEKTRSYTKEQIDNYYISYGYGDLRFIGYRYAWSEYIVFNDKNNKYLFKIFCNDVTKEAFKELMTKQTQ